MSHVCNEATARACLSSGDVLFTEGSSGNRMLFLLCGKLQYGWRASEKQIGLVEEPATPTELTKHMKQVCFVKPGDWCCEGSLWTHWVHVGICQACEDSDLLTIDATEFATQTNKHVLMFESVSRYAHAFVALMNESALTSSLTDVPLAREPYEKMASHAFARKCFQRSGRGNLVEDKGVLNAAPRFLFFRRSLSWGASRTNDSKAPWHEDDDRSPVVPERPNDVAFSTTAVRI